MRTTPRQLRRRRAGAIVTLGAAVAIALALASGGKGGKGAGMATERGRGTTHTVVPGALPARLKVSVAQTGTLPGPVQDGAATALGQGGTTAAGQGGTTATGQALLAGGLDQAEASSAQVLRLTPTGATQVGTLPTALHDAAAAYVGGAAWVFGGGQTSSFSQIVRVDTPGTAQPAGQPSAPASDLARAQPAGQLPTPASDVATAVVGETAYIVGGYTGTTPLRTILAWRPGQGARVAGTLPKPLRYAAVAALNGKVVIAGGTSGEAASRDVYRFDPSSGQVAHIGQLPGPLTHAGAAAVGGVVLVLGGREAAQGTQTGRILAIFPNGRVAPVGRLPLALSDMAAVALNGRVVLAGGRDGQGRLHAEIFTATLGS